MLRKPRTLCRVIAWVLAVFSVLFFAAALERQFGSKPWPGAFVIAGLLLIGAAVLFLFPDD
jgi:hypothetical protein